MPPPSPKNNKKRYETGTYLHKKNTFTDFIAAAEHLIERRYTAADRLCIQGRSAGGLLIGAVLNMRPDLFAAAIAGGWFFCCLVSTPPKHQHNQPTPTTTNQKNSSKT